MSFPFNFPATKLLSEIPSISPKFSRLLSTLFLSLTCIKTFISFSGFSLISLVTSLEILDSVWILKNNKKRTPIRTTPKMKDFGLILIKPLYLLENIY